MHGALVIIFELASTITGGHDDPGHPAVVALLAGSDPFCTGTLVAPDEVLTAAHCLDIARPTAVFAGLEPPIDGAAPAPGDAILAVSSTAAVPDFDLAVLHLAHPARIAPIPVATARTIDQLAGTQALVVGFGLASTRDPSRPRKRSGTAAIVSVDDPDSLRIEPDPAQPCVGDSGGPLLVEVDGVEHVAGVASLGDTDCARFATYARADQASDALATGGCNAGGGHGAMLALAMLAVSSRRCGHSEAASRRRPGAGRGH